MIRSLGSVPIAENMSANLATFWSTFLVTAFVIFRYLQNYRRLVKFTSTSRFYGLAIAVPLKGMAMSDKITLVVRFRRKLLDPRESYWLALDAHERARWHWPVSDLTAKIDE
jgi:hypothetical protein